MESGPEFQKFHGRDAYKSHNTCPTDILDYKDLKQTSSATTVRRGDQELRPPHSSLDYSPFQDTICRADVKQALLKYLYEVNLAHDAWQALQRDTTCSSTKVSSWGRKTVIDDETRPSRPSVEEMFHLSCRFSSTLRTMVNAGMLESRQIDPVTALLVHSKLQDIHDIIIRPATQLLPLWKDAIMQITN
jgi:hypothetical protein